MKRKKITKILSNYFDFKENSIKNIVIDSRKASKHDLFIAIRGGNNFINKALESGAYVIYDDKKVKVSSKDALYVEDSVEFLQNLAKSYRNELNTKIVAITGSNGKTTTKDILAEILSLKFKGKKTQGNLNNHIGLPLSLLQIEDDDEYMVLEMGMSGFGEIKLLSQISMPDYALITNIGDSHLEFLLNRENVFKAKTEIIPFVKKDIVVNGDDFYLKNLTALKTGKKSYNNLIIKKIMINNLENNFEILYQNKKYILKTNLIGEHNIYNICMALLISEKLGIKIDDTIEKIKNLKITAMRFEIIEKEEKTYINDAYNASPVSMKFALETFSKIYNEKYKIAVLGDMLELGENSRKMHEELEKTILDTDISEIYLFGQEMKYLYKMIKGKKIVYYFNTKQEIVKKISEKKGKIAVLLKGSRGMQLEKIILDRNEE